jgi:hypothetical protein
MSYAAEIPTIFGLVAAILDLHHVPTELGVRRFFVVSGVVENMGIAGGVTFLCHIRPKLYLLPVWQPPS